MYSWDKLKSNGESKMKLNEIYSELPTPAQATVRKIIQECKKSKSSENFVLDIARRRVLATLARTNPGNELIQSAVITGLPLDIRELDLDWDTTFDLLAAEKPSLLAKIMYPIFQPLIGYLIGVKIPVELTHNRSQRLIFGRWLAIASVIYFSEIANREVGIGN